MQELIADSSQQPKDEARTSTKAIVEKPGAVWTKPKFESFPLNSALSLSSLLHQGGGFIPRLSS